MKLLLLLVVLGVAISAEAIKRQDVLNRAAFWVQRKVRYSMSAYHPDPQGKSYRTDCSGYVSMSWATGTSYSTVTLPNVSVRINKDQLKAGDVMCICGGGSAGAAGHVLIFEKWANPEKTKYWTYEQHGPNGAPTDHRIVNYPYNGSNRYLPYRYKQIQD